jgi:hypothetical protein
MTKILTRWRPLALLALLAALLTGGAAFLGESSGGGTAEAGTVDVSSISCADVYLVELEEPIATTPPHDAGDPLLASELGLPVAISLTNTQHNTGDDTTTAVGQTYNLGIAGVIGGLLPSVPRCASVDKVVADVTTVTTEPPGSTDSTPFSIDIDDNAGNPPVAGMIVYWNSSTAGRKGFYHVNSATSTTANLQRTKATCNTTPADGTALAQLWACAPSNKGIVPYAFSPTNVVKDNVQGEDARPTGTGTFNQGTLTSTSVSCGVSTGVQEGGAQNAWTRTELTTVTSGAGSDKVPSLGIAVLFNPTNPGDCANIIGQTNRSTNVTVVWPRDSAAIEGAVGNWDSDYDKDGCRDVEELGSPLPTQLGSAGSFTGGRDPFNPNDCDRDLNGIFGIEVDAIPITLSGTTVVPGAQYRCRADIAHDLGTDALTVRVVCYGDNPALVVNPAAAGGNSLCPPAPLATCGDGLDGGSYPVGTAPPPKDWPLASGAGESGASCDDLVDSDSDTIANDGCVSKLYTRIGSAQTQLTGSYDPDTDLISLTGCISDVAGAQGPNVYVTSSDVDVLTGHGHVDIWLAQASCAVPGGAPSFDDVNVQLTEHAPRTVGTGVNDANYDFDLDGCPDRSEISNTPTSGGLRDPFNRWDYFNPQKDGQNRVADILAVVNKFFIDYPAAGYTTQTDRTAVAGSNAWNAGPPNGQHRVDDILAEVKQFFHDC